MSIEIATELMNLPSGLEMAAAVYRAGDACRIVHLPGGSGAVARVLASVGAVVHALAYPSGAGHPFPDGIEASYQALALVAAMGAGRLLVAGEAGGANMAAGLALMCRDRLGPALAGQILISPMLDPRMATCSVRRAGAGPVGCRWDAGWRDYLGTPDVACHPYAVPASALRLAGLPPALILTALDDPTQDEANDYAVRLRASGVGARVVRIDTDASWPDGPGGAEPSWAAPVRDAVAALLGEMGSCGKRRSSKAARACRT